jgi:hypothetical protein
MRAIEAVRHAIECASVEQLITMAEIALGLEVARQS